MIGGKLFGIGEATSITSGSSGEIFLRINDPDSGLGDNEGVLEVQITHGE